MPKMATIEAIRRLNPTAAPDFLAAFPEDDLAQYLDRLHGCGRDGAGRTTGDGDDWGPVELAEQN